MSGYRLEENTLKKNSILYFLIIALCFSNIIVVKSENYVNADFEIHVLETLGLTEDIKLGEIANVTVEQFGIIMSKLTGYESGGLEEAAMLGYIDYYDDGELDHNSKVRYRTVITSIIKLLGYNQEASLSNLGYSQYYGVASSLGITRGVNALPDDLVSGAVLAKLLYRSVEVPLMQRVSYGQTYRIEISRDKTLLTENHSIYKGRGQITANELTSITGKERLGKGFIEIDEELFVNVGETDAKFLLGYYIDYYYYMDDSTDEKTLLWIFADEQRNNELFLKSEDIAKYDDFKYSYYPDEGRIQEASINRGASVIYNGIVVEAAILSSAQLMPENGDVTLLDVSNDGLYDIVLIMDYEAGVVSSVDKNYKVLYVDVPTTQISGDKTEYIIITKKYELNDIANYEIYDNKYNLLTIDNIYLSDVVWCAKSLDGSLLTVLVSRETVNGTIEEIEYNMERSVVKIGDKYYKTFDDIEKFYNIGVGVAGLFRLDVDGKIIAVEARGDESMVFAYLITAKISSGIDSALELKLFDGEIKAVKCHTTVQIDNNYFSNSHDIYDHFIIEEVENDIAVITFQDQLIRYSTNANGRVTKIETASSTAPLPGEPDRLYIEGALPEAGSSQSSLYFVKAMGNWFGNYFGIADDAKVFTIPNDRSDDTKYALTGPEVFGGSGTYYGVTGYNINPNSERAVAAVYDGEVTLGSNVRTNDINVITRITRAIDEEGRELKRLYYTNGGAENFAYTYDEEYLEEYKAGDIIRIERGGSGQISSLRMAFDTKLKAVQNSYETRPYTDEFRVGQGTIIRKKGNTIILDTPSPTRAYIRNESIPVNYSNIIICEKTSKGVNVFTSTADDVRVGDYIVYRSWYVQVRDIVIYRGWDY